MIGCNWISGAYQWSADVQDVPREKQFVKTITITDRVASAFPLKNAGNYYHWMCEGLLRVIVLQELILDMPGYEDVKLLVPGGGGSHIKETLQVRCTSAR